MKKTDAIKLFGHRQKDLCIAIGRCKGAISMWPEELDEDKTNLVVGAAYRRGIHIPSDICDPVSNK